MKTMKFWRLAFAMLAAFRIYTVTDAGHLQIITAPLIYSPPTGQQATLLYIVSIQ